MNRKITFIVLSLLIGQLAFAQNCKYKTNELDKTTNKMVKETKSKVVWEKPFDSQGKMTAKKVGDDFFLTFVYDRGLGGAEFVVNKGNELIFVLENGTEVKLQRGDEKETYPITKDQLDLLMKSKVSVIQYWYTEVKTNTYTHPAFYKVSDSQAENIQELVKCVM